MRALAWLIVAWPLVAWGKADLLTAEERAWLSTNTPVAFVSQTTYPPFEFVDDEGRRKGMCLDLVRWMAGELDFEVDFVDMAFRDAQQAVLNGDVHVLTSLFYSRERDERFDFTKMTWEVPALIFVREERPDISEVEDLRGKRVAMQRGDYAAEFLKSRGIDYTWVATASFAEAVDRVAAGEADALIGDQQIVLHHLFSNQWADAIKSVGLPLYVGRNSLAVRDGEATLLAILNKGIALAQKRGVIDRITYTWLGAQYEAESSWFYRNRILLITGGLMLVSFIGGLLVWVVRLRRLVEQRTVELNESRNPMQPLFRSASGAVIRREWWVMAALLLPLFLAGDLALRHGVALPAYEALERKDAERMLSIVRYAIDQELMYVQRVAKEWAGCQDTPALFADGDQAYDPANQRFSAHGGPGLAMALGVHGRVVWRLVSDEHLVPAAEALATGVIPRAFLGEAGGSGVVVSGGRVWLAAALPVRAGDGSRTGTLIAGIGLHAGTLSRLIHHLGVDVRVASMDEILRQERGRDVVDALVARGSAVREVSDGLLNVYSLVPDLEGQSGAVIMMAIPRVMVQQGRTVASVLSLSVIIGFVVLLGLMTVWFSLFMRETLRRQAHIETLVENRTAALATSEERFRLLFENTPNVAVQGYGPDGNIRYWNQAAEQLYGYTRAEALGRHLGELLLPAAAAGAFREELARCVLGNPPAAPTEEILIRKDGAAAHVISSRAVVSGRDRNPEIFRLDTDISARKRAEAELERLMMAIEQSGEQVVITDVSADILYVNPAFERVSGYAREEVVGKNVRIMKSGEHPAAFYRDLWTTILRGETWRGRITNRRKDGTLFVDETAISPVRAGRDGAIVNFVAVKRDITAQISLEEKLRQAHKMEAVGHLAGGIAHDFNNLLQVIQGYGQVALEEAGDQNVLRDSIGEMMKACKRAAALVSQLLAFSRRQVLQLAEIDLNRVVSDASNLLRRVIGEHIALEVTLADRVDTVRADPNQIEQILMNLCVNSRDAMPKGGSIRIVTSGVTVAEGGEHAHVEVRPGRYVRLAVSDTGCGIPPGLLGQIFDPFFTTKDLGKGTGLGLATVYGLVKQHDGFIHATSVEGEGTTIEILFPVASLAAATATRTQERSTSTPGGTETILVAEDEAPVLKVTRMMLERSGYRVLTAADGEEAVAVFKKHRDAIDLVMLDVMMPRLSGRGAYEQIKAIAPETKVLFASGYSMSAIHTDFVLDDGLELLQKPFTRDALLARVRSLLG